MKKDQNRRDLLPYRLDLTAVGLGQAILSNTQATMHLRLGFHRTMAAKF